MSILEDWRVEAHMRRMRRELWWERLGMLLVAVSAGGVLWACVAIGRWLCGVRW